MALTEAESVRLVRVEEALAKLANLVKGAGSKNQLNRLLVLAQEKTRQLETRATALEAQAAELLTLARKLQ